METSTMLSPHQDHVDVAELEEELSHKAEWLRHWLMDHAFDLWWEQGSDKAGGFYERLDQTGMPLADDHRRARVQPRQVYCYAVAGQMGWNGPWKQAIQHGLNWFEIAYRRDNGLYGSIANAQGEIIDDRFDLYNHAFALFGYAAAASAIPEHALKYHARAIEIVTLLKANYSHPIGGFEEACPPREPLCANPHMHLLEAALSWEISAPRERLWQELADEIANLALRNMIDRESGVLPEFFDRQWLRLPGSEGRIVEPGHQFEWAWLLIDWSVRRSNTEAFTAAKRLFDAAERHGICPDRRVAIMSLHDDGTIHNDLARLWSQTEWLKAALCLAQTSNGNEKARYLSSAKDAINAIRIFIDNTRKGIWLDKWPKHSYLTDEPSPASTFYHIVAAYREFERYMQKY